jgi:predicted membrane-bound spermidine synthase
MNKDWLWRPSLIVFISNACVMVIELVAGRIIAPFVGVSLYTWTSVIGVILAGMSIGNYVGGKLADRFASRRTLGTLFILAGLGSLSVLVTANVFGGIGLSLAPWLPFIARMVVFVGVIFLIPSVVLGCISPLVIKLTLQDLSRTGKVVGNIYAASALGSILGTFATGYFLISWLGTRAILLGVGLVLIVMGLLLGQWFRRARVATAISVLVIAATLLMPLPAALQGPCLRETNYFCIRVRETTVEDNRSVMVLTLDRLVHSYSSLEDPRRLVYGYEKVAAESTEYVTHNNTLLNALFIGGGGYTFPRYLEAVYPQSKIDVAEIDPGVTETAYQYLGLRRNTRIRTMNEDARTFVKMLPDDVRYNLVLGDAFNDFSVPYHLTTREFNEMLRKHMTDDGIYILNIIDGAPHQFVSAFMRTLKLTFGSVYLIPTGKDWQERVRNTYIVLASPHPLDLAKLRSFTGNDNIPNIDNWLLPQEQVDALLASGLQIVLTDDYVPVDNLLAPTFEASEAAR